MKQALKLALAVGTVSAMLAGCSKETQETADAIKNLQSIASSASNATKSANKLEELRNTRIKNGDTLSMAAAELAKYIPSSIPGYTASEPETESVSVQGMSYSSASREYTSADKGTVSITLLDYNGAYASYTMASALFALQIHVDNSEETSGTFQTSNELINGHETFSKTSHDATVVYGVGARFWLEIKATNQTSSEWAKGLAKTMDLAKLASM